MTEKVIEVKDLTFSYQPTGDPVLQDVNISIKKKEFLAILGPNGGGKTTLIKIILGLLKSESGKVFVFGKSPSQASGRIGYVPQHPNLNQKFPISVMDVVLMGRLKSAGLTGRFSKKDRRMARQSLEKVGMEMTASEHIDDLSGGQQQRVFFARALACEPEILILDEPTSSLDTHWASSVYDLLNQLNQEEDKTIIVVSHDVGILSSYVKSVACVNRWVYYHDTAEISEGMLDNVYQCPVELVAHGMPHRVLREHKGEKDD